ncbi:Uma2 family endonuclease [Candidatus Chloroploca sp. Khr17]|uniref:Uma2 family endonuclease n=1 Tax=Candidatus Chloroploca sp. Khr17 TaxID=2496869 RepID=UPI002105BAC2|nr:Uma2 family endonuclease [Candidatus Chloroploca sp. Khr17]
MKHEYYAGTVYAMAGASEQYNIIALNIAAALHTHLRGRSCRAYPSDMRVKVIKTGLNTYPDFTIVCGQTQFTDPVKRDTVINPTVIIEILSPSTERYDRGMKFQHYRTITSLQEYILIAQDKPYVERFVRHEQNEWVFSEAIGLEAIIPITSIQGSLALQAIYEQVSFIPEIVPGITRDVPEEEDQPGV